MKTFITGIAHCDEVGVIAQQFVKTAIRVLEQCPNGIQDLIPIMEKCDAAADPYFPLYQDNMIEMFPDAQWIIIDAPIEDSDIGLIPDPAFVKEKLEYLSGKVNPIRITFDHGKIKKCAINECQALADEVEPMQETPNNLEMQRLLEEMCKPQPEAYEVITEMWNFALLIDHVFDGDGVRKATILRALKSMFIRMGLNPFYQRNCAALSMAFIPIIAAWEHSNTEGASKIYAIQLYSSLPALISYIIGGQSYTDYYLPKIHKLLEIGWKEDGKRDNHGVS